MLVPYKVRDRLSIMPCTSRLSKVSAYCLFNAKATIMDVCGFTNSILDFLRREDFSSQIVFGRVLTHKALNRLYLILYASSRLVLLTQCQGYYLVLNLRTCVDSQLLGTFFIYRSCFHGVLAPDLRFGEGFRYM